MSSFRFQWALPFVASWWMVKSWTVEFSASIFDLIHYILTHDLSIGIFSSGISAHVFFLLLLVFCVGPLAWLFSSSWKLYIDIKSSSRRNWHILCVCPRGNRRLCGAQFWLWSYHISSWSNSLSHIFISWWQPDNSDWKLIQIPPFSTSYSSTSFVSSWQRPIIYNCDNFHASSGCIFWKPSVSWWRSSQFCNQVSSFPAADVTPPS